MSSRLELRGGGWASPIGFVPAASVELALETKGIRWQKVDVPNFHFSHTAAVLVMQQMPLQDFFPPDAHLYQGDERIILGPLLLLKGRLSAPWDPPMRLRDAVFAALEHVPEGMTREEVQGYLLSQVL